MLIHLWDISKLCLILLVILMHLCDLHKCNMYHIERLCNILRISQYMLSTFLWCHPGHSLRCILQTRSINQSTPVKRWRSKSTSPLLQKVWRRTLPIPVRGFEFLSQAALQVDSSRVVGALKNAFQLAGIDCCTFCCRFFKFSPF